MAEDKVGTPNSKVKTKHDIKLTKDQYNQILMRVLSQASMGQEGQQPPNPYANLPVGRPSGMQSMRVGMGAGLGGPPGVVGPAPMTPPEDPRLQALMQQIQNVQPQQPPQPQGMRSLEEIMRGGR